VESLKHLIYAGVLCGAAATASAQTAATFTNVLDVATDNAAQSVFGSTYSVSENKFLASKGGLGVRVYNGNTGAYETDLNMTGIPAATSLGLFGMACGTDGSIFSVQVDVSQAFQWANISAAPTLAANPSVFWRNGKVIGTGAATKLVVTGASDAGPVNVYTTSDDATYTETETITTVGSKSAMGVNSAITKLWTIPDTANDIQKGVKTAGVWALDPSFVPPPGTLAAATVVYDEVNNVVFAWKTTTVFALHADTGVQIGTATVVNGANSTPGYNGSIVSSVPGSGTLWMIARGATATNAVMQKFTYTVTGVSAVADWAIY